VRTAWAAILTAALSLASAVPAGSAQGPEPPPIMPLSQVQPGMRGYGLTVVHGTAIQRFDVEILGILAGGSTSHLILFRVSGPVIQQAGGTASGMSGSPIYLEGRIAGSLSYGYHFAGPDADLSLATPIEEMLKVLVPGRATTESRRPRLYQTRVPIRTPAGPVTRVVVMDSPRDATSYNAAPLPTMVAVAPVAVPVFASRVSPAAFAVLSRALGRYNVVPMQGYVGSREFQAPPLEPGSSLGVELVRGEVEMGAIGTVTYRNADMILAFGHPLLNAGEAPMLLTTAWIDTIVRSTDFPFKEGSVGTTVGTVTQDRAVGLAGVVGQFPRLFGIRVSVRNGGRTQTLKAQAVSRPDLAEALVPVTVLSLVQRAVDSVSGGSARVRLTLRARGLPRELVREDITYDAGDIATASVLDVPGATQLLFGNFFRSLDPLDMAVDIEVSPEPNTALLVKAVPQTRVVRPGETVRVALALRPFGDAPEVERSVEFSVPANFPPGPAFLLVGTAGASNDPTPPAAKFQQQVMLEGSPPSGIASLDEGIDQFEHANKSTELLIELVPSAVLTAVGSNANPALESQAGASLATEWVVLGKFQVPMTVR
jgi:SpoIVB peptidase S55